MQPQKPSPALSQNQILDSEGSNQTDHSCSARAVGFSISYVTSLFPGESGYIRLPQLDIGEAVMIVSDGDTVIVDFGHIRGLEWCPDYSRIKGWWYAVKFTDGPSQGYQDWVPEGDLCSLSLKHQMLDKTPTVWP